MKYKLEIRSIWEFGQRKDEEGRPHQEDSLFPHHGEIKPTDRVFILCDGMGGHAAGEVASATVCDAMSQTILPLAAKEPFVFTDEDMKTAVTAAFDALDALDDGASGKGKMGTTMTALVLHNGGATIAHMGDSRVYHIRPGKQREDTRILFQTRDHSLVNDLVAVGEITAEEAKTHPQRNVITRALQPHTDRRPRPDIAKTIVDIKVGDYFYLCSDGMLEIMDENAIRFNFSEKTGDIDSKVQLLTTATCQNRDNHTAILVHVLEVEDPLPIVEPKVVSTPASADTPKEASGPMDDEVRGEATDAEKAPRHSRRLLIIATFVLLALLVGCAILLLNNNKKGNSSGVSNTTHKKINNKKSGSTSRTGAKDDSSNNQKDTVVVDSNSLGNKNVDGKGNRDNTSKTAPATSTGNKQNAKASTISKNGTEVGDGKSSSKKTEEGNKIIENLIGGEGYDPNTPEGGKN